MDERSPQDIMHRFCAGVGACYGLDLTEQHWPGLAQRMERLCRQKQWEPWPQCADWMLRNLHRLDVRSALLQEITVGETYFFRERQGLERAVDHIEKAVQKGHGPFPWVRVWCAGCSNGEEAYTLAAMVAEHLPALPAEAVAIMASDVSPAALERAMRGAYGEWSFRASPPTFKARYFERRGDKYWLGRDRHPGHGLRRRVQFREINLATTPYPPLPDATSRFDVILCRNVLMYLQPDVIERCMVGFHRSLADDGLLILGVTEYFSTPARARGGEDLKPAAYSWESLPTDMDTQPPPAPAEQSASAPAEVPIPAPGQPPNLEAQFEQACHIRQEGDLQAAVAAFRRVLYLSPSHVPSHVALGGLFRDLGMERLSRRHWSTAERLMTQATAEAGDTGNTMAAQQVAEVARATSSRAWR